MYHGIDDNGVNSARHSCAPAPVALQGNASSMSLVLLHSFGSDCIGAPQPMDVRHVARGMEMVGLF